MNYRYILAFAMMMLVGVVNGTPIVAIAEPLQGITIPKADVTLSFVKPGRVVDVLVKPGTTVEQGQPLIQLYNEPEKIQSEQLKMISEDLTKIHAAEAKLAQKRADLQRLKRAKAKGAASRWEVDHSNLDVRLAELALKSALIEHEQYRRKYKHSLSELASMRLEAPIGGRIEEVDVEVGESVGPLGPVLRVVQNDPLWIDMPVPMTQALDLSVGQRVWVMFPGGSASSESPNGRIIDISAVADAASETLRIRIEVPNPDQRPAGERVTIAFSPDEKQNMGAALPDRK